MGTGRRGGAATTLGRLDYAMFIVAYFVVQITITLGVLAVLRPKGSAEAVTLSGASS